MKRFVTPTLVVLLSFAFSLGLNAQKDKKGKKVTIKIEKEVDGKKTLVDTTFTLAEGEDLKKVLEKYGIKADMHEKHAGTFDIDIEYNDSLNEGTKQMVWVSVDDDGKKEKIKKKHKKIIIIDDEDEDVEIIRIKGDNVMHFENEDEHVVIERAEGDSVNFTKKIVISDDDHGIHKKHVKVYEFKNDSSHKSGNVMFFSDDNENEDVIIKHKKKGNDSIEVIVKKIKKGKPGKHIIISDDSDFNWTSDTDIESNKVEIRIFDIDDAGLKFFKQKSDFKTFNTKNFNVFLDGDNGKLKLDFSTDEKGKLNVKIIDEKGKEVFADTDNQFNGEYKKEIETLKGTFYIQFAVGKKFYLSKMILDWENK